MIPEIKAEKQSVSKSEVETAKPPKEVDEVELLRQEMNVLNARIAELEHSLELVEVSA